MVSQATVYGAGAVGLAAGILIWIQLLRSRGEGTAGRYGYVGVIPIVATIAYAVMAFEVTTITVDGVGIPAVRYLDWLVTTMVLIGYVGYVAGAPRRVIGGLVAVDALMIVVGFVGVVTPGTGRPVAFAVSSLCYLGLLGLLYGVLPGYAREQSPERHRLFTTLQNHVGLLWLGYPVVWAAGPLGLEAVSTLAVAVIITFMDVMAKTPYVYFVYSHRDAFGHGANTETDAPAQPTATAGD